MHMKTWVKFFTFVVAFMGLTFTMCKLDSDEPDPVITYTVAADGNATAASTTITFTFATALTGLAVEDITLVNGTGQVTTGALIHDGDGRVWNLGITVHKTGTVKAAIGKAGIAEGETELTVYKEPDIVYTATANGAANSVTSDKITFSFGAMVTGLTLDQITLTNDTGTVTGGTLSENGQNWYLEITVQQAGNVKVKIARDGIETGEKTVTVHKAPDGPNDGGESKTPGNSRVTLVDPFTDPDAALNTFTLKRGASAESEGYAQQLTLNIDGAENPEWYVDGDKWGESESLTLYARDFTHGKHYISVQFEKNGKVYDAGLSFTVEVE
jgi:hypothetical protein